MKKLISIMLTLILAMSSVLFLSCNNKEVDNVITIWHDKEDGIIEVLKEILQPLSDEIEIKFVRKDGMTDSLKMVGNDVNSAPDMFIFAHDKVGLFSELGILEPVTSFISQDKLNSEYVNTTIQAVTYKNEIYQLPMYFESLLFMYNKNLMSEQDVPKTTSQLLTYMKNNTDKSAKMYGFVEQHSTAYYSIPWINAYGGSVLSATGEPTINTSEMIDSLSYHKQFLEYMPGESAYSTINTLFLNNMAHSIIGGPWLVPSAREKGIDLGFAPMPIVDETDSSLAPYLGVQGIYVLKCAVQNSSNKELIQKIMTALNSSEVGGKLAQASGCAPAMNESYNLDYIANDEMVKIMRETALNAVPIPNLPEMDIMFNVVGKLLEDVYLNDEDIALSCQEWQDKAEQLIEVMR